MSASTRLRRRQRSRCWCGSITLRAKAATCRCAHGLALAGGETNTWTQIAGPPVTLDASDPNRVLFVAPDVARDTALTFRVTRRTASGAIDTDDVFVLVENYAQAPSDPSGSVAVRVQRSARLAYLSVSSQRAVCRCARALYVRSQFAIHRWLDQFVPAIDAAVFASDNVGCGTDGRPDHGSRGRVARLDGRNIRAAAADAGLAGHACGCSTALPRS